MKQQEIKNLKYRLGLDLGTNSIGWCMLKLNEENEPQTVIKAGVCIYSDGRKDKDKTPLAVERRTARSMRKNVDRRLNRKKSLLAYLITQSIIPQDETQRTALVLENPYELRAMAIKNQISLPLLGRAIMHLSKRRGFKSNRNADKKQKDDGKIKPAVERMKKLLLENNFQTIGEYLYRENQAGNSVRTRLGKVDGKDGYPLYIDRSMAEDEFDKIINFQKQFHPILTDEVIGNIRHIIFYQRPLKPQEIGKCSINQHDTRLAKAHVLAQDFIVLQKIMDLRVFIIDEYSERALIPQEIQILKNELKAKPNMKFNAIRKLFKKCGLPYNYGRFSHEETEDSLQGSLTNATMSKEEMFGNGWFKLSPCKQFEVIDKLLSISSDEELFSYLTKDCSLSSESAENVINDAFKKLPDGYLKYGKLALEKLVPLMDEQMLDLTNAKIAAKFPITEELGTYDLLPYYGIPLQSSVAFGTGDTASTEEVCYGKIANPTVHIVLNQLKKLVNTIIETYGKPHEIVVEVGRDLKKSQKEKEREQKQNKINRTNNDRRRNELEKLGLKINAENILILKLWEELEPLDRKCVYSGKTIPYNSLFTDEVQVEHILPFSRTLDDGYSNKILSFREANYYKGNRSPYEAFGQSVSGYDYSAIIARAGKLPPNKVWRFKEDAMKEFNKENGFLARQLNDTRYLAKIALKYLRLILTDDKKQNIWAIPGHLTSLIRGKLGLNKILSEGDAKTRNDHRHHAVDAFVISITSRSMLQQVATAAARADSKQTNRLIENMPEPFPKYYETIKQAIGNIKVYHRPDHGLQGALHKDTSYGFVDPKRNEGGNVVYRKPATVSLSEKELASIRDLRIRNKITELKNDKTAIAKYFEENNIRRLRILKSEKYTIPIKDKQGNDYKYFVGGDNLCMEIYEKADGKKYYEIIERFHANQKGFQPQWVTQFPDARLYARLFKGDVLRYKNDEGKYVYGLIKSMKQSSEIILLPLNETGEIIKREKEEGKKIFINNSVNPLFNTKKAEKVIVTIIGKVKKAALPDKNFWEKKNERKNS